MREWMSYWIKKSMNNWEWMNEWEWINERLSEWVNEWMSE